MRSVRRSTSLAAAAGALLLLAVPATASAHPANGDGGNTGTRSLVAYLTANGNGAFDNNPFDFDIATQAVAAVIAANPKSPVALLADGKVALTAFLPEDFAFRNLVHQLTGKWVGSEEEVFKAVASLGIPTVEAVLLYHVVPGKTITSKDAVNSDGAVLPTALAGATIKVDVLFKAFGIIKLIDANKSTPNPFLNPFLLDRNKGNRQIAHGITAVLQS